MNAAPLPGGWIWDVIAFPGNINQILVVFANFGLADHAWTGVVPATGTATWTATSGAGASSLPDVPYYIEKTKKLFPNASLTVVQSPREFLKNKTNDFDAFVYAAESGSAWTLVFPQYSIAIPHPSIIKIPLAYAVSLDDPQMRNFISTWITLKKKDETIESLYNYWILGHDKDNKKTRWCIKTDVLGWK